MGEEKNCTRFWWESLKERDHLEKPRCRWMNGIRMDLREFGLGGVDWIRLAQDRDRWQAVVSAVISLWVFCAMEVVMLKKLCKCF
jgi:hypothetical protein